LWYFFICQKKVVDFFERLQISNLFRTVWRIYIYIYKTFVFSLIQKQMKEFDWIYRWLYLFFWTKLNWTESCRDTNTNKFKTKNYIYIFVLQICSLCKAKKRFIHQTCNISYFNFIPHLIVLKRKKKQLNQKSFEMTIHFLQNQKLCWKMIENQRRIQMSMH